jgi:hypothetical protein
VVLRDLCIVVPGTNVVTIVLGCARWEIAVRIWFEFTFSYSVVVEVPWFFGVIVLDLVLGEGREEEPASEYVVVPWLYRRDHREMIIDSTNPDRLFVTPLEFRLPYIVVGQD